MWNHNNVFNIKTSSRLLAACRLMLCLFVLILGLFTTSGCGGGGGGGNNGGGGGAPEAFVMIGTVEFSTATSIDISGLETSWPTPQQWNWTWFSGSISYAMTQKFEAAFIVVSGQNLPVLKMTSTSTEGGSVTNYYSYLAVARNGELYNLTAGLKGSIPVGDPHVLVSQPRFFSRKNYTVGQSWTDGVQGNVGGRNDPTWTRTVVSTNATSPAGFTNCVHVRITLPPGNVDGIESIDEYWKDGYGCVENYETLESGGGMGDNFVRQSIAFAG